MGRLHRTCRFHEVGFDDCPLASEVFEQQRVVSDLFRAFLLGLGELEELLLKSMSHRPIALLVFFVELRILLLQEFLRFILALLLELFDRQSQLFLLEEMQFA